MSIECRGLYEQTLGRSSQTDLSVFTLKCPDVEFRPSLDGYKTRFTLARTSNRSETSLLCFTKYFELFILSFGRDGPL